MGITRFIVTVLWLTGQHNMVFGQDQPSDRSDLTMYIDYYYSKVTCVAETNSTGDALALLKPLKDTNMVQECKYIYPIVMTEIGCDFEKNKCDYWKTNGLDIIQSGMHKFLPITDERWNLLPQFRTTGPSRPEYSNKYVIASVNFHISVSVRSTRDVHMLLCDSDYYNPDSAKCYWIMIDAFNREHNKITALRKCVKGVPNDYPRQDADCSRLRKRIEFDEQLFKEMEWRHFTIIRENGNNLKLLELNENNPIFEYEDSSPLDIRRLFFRGYNKAEAEWKVHDYQFLTITKPNTLLKLGPVFYGNSQNEICVSLYVAMCPKCTISFQISSDNGDSTKTEIKVQGKDGAMMKWQNIKIRTKSYLNIIYNLYAYASMDTDTKDPFWAVDDIRRCHANEIRIISSTVSQISTQQIACQSLTYRQRDDTNNKDNEEGLQCSDPYFTGSFCNITCKSLFQNDFCDAKKICRPATRNEQSCICSPGFTGTTCSETCSVGRYGYNCSNQCGYCSNPNYCNKITGNCGYGCKDGYEPLKCMLTTLPVLVNPPALIQISHTCALLQLKQIAVSGVKEPLTYQIEFKAKNSRGWQQFGNHQNLEVNSETEVTELKPETNYVVRAVLYTDSNESYKQENIPTLEFNTTCEVERIIIMQPASRSLQFILQGNEENCMIQNYFWEITENDKLIKNGRFSDVFTDVTNLKPYTQYKIVIGNDAYPKFAKMQLFNTLEDAPEQIQNLKLESASSNTLLLTWDPPTVTNGEIRHYIVSYQRRKYISCLEETSDYISYETVTPSDNLRVLLENLTPYSQYEVIVQAVTILNGTEHKQYYNTNQTANADDEELPSTMSVESDSTFVKLSWELPLCSKIKGPLLYDITTKCLEDAWCGKDISYEPVDSSRKTINVDKLIPWTHYLIEIRATRSSSSLVTTNSESKEFQTKIGAPPPVRNLTVYSKTKNSISIKWLAPYPPHGELDGYQLQQCYDYYSTNCNWGHYVTIIPKRCKLWDEYICYDINVANPNYYYNIYIKAKNKDKSELSNPSRAFTRTVQEKSEKPWNVTTDWKENKLALYWNHPNITNGPLKYFLISLQQIETEIIEEQKTNKYNYKLPVEEPLKRYNYLLDKSIPYSSSYEISIIGVNEFHGEIESKIVDTPPETPELTADVSVNEDEITNTTVTILIPGINANTKSSNSFLYVIVSKTQSNHIKKRDTAVISHKKEILKFSETPEQSWIAVELEPSASAVAFVIGDNSELYSKQLNETLVNKALEPESTYGITVVLMNQYKNQKSYNPNALKSITTATTVTSGQNGIYALLLLFLLVPAILWFVYRKSLSKSNRPRSVIPGLSLVRTDVLHEPDVIPLTESSRDENVIPKKPAIAPKPSPKNLVHHQSVKVEINKTETNLFHSRLVHLNHLEQYIKDALENGELAEQHALFPRGQTKPWDYGMIKDNKFKNRYNNLIAYDHTRVKLEKMNKDKYSDYINANYINGYKQDKAYIATQGPKITTVNDFWRMIWQEKVQYIVMLANVVEGGKKKCEKYWPDVDSLGTYGYIEVSFTKLEVYADFEFRTFEVKKDDEKRTVTQLHFTSWPDHGVPLYPQSLVPFLKKMLTISQGNAPIVVHCSAGVGRTGTIILCDICLRMAAREGAIDVLRYLHEIREERANLVDNIDQYKLVHMVLLECLLAPNTTIACNIEFSTALQKLTDEGGLQTQLNYLQKTAWQDQALNFSTTKTPDPANDVKNRFDNIVPLVNRIYISRYPTDDENSDYINAVPVDGFRFKEQFIVTQTPMPSTQDDFWRMIMEKEVKVIVSLNNIPLENETCIIFWPLDNDELTPMTNLTIKYHKLQSHDVYDIHSVILLDNNNEVTWKVQIVQYKNWNHTEKVPNNIEDLVMLWEDTENLSRGNYPMVVTCFDGATASGLFVALSFVIEKIKLEQQCDACLAVRVIRRNRKQFVTDKTQFEFLYKATVVYLSMFETYSNFQPVVNKSIKKESEE